MSFPKKKETGNVTRARQRLAGMKLIDANRGRIINYGGEERVLTQAELDSSINEYARKLEEYNQLLSQADQKSNELEALEKHINGMYSGVLKGAVPKFGADSHEIEQLGGTRISDRETPVRKVKDEVKA